MNKIFLSQKQLTFLLKNIEDSDLQQKIKNSLKKLSNDEKYCLFQLSNDSKWKISQSLADLLCNIGMKDDNELNSTGYLIEELIDIFNPYEEH